VQAGFFCNFAKIKNKIMNRKLGSMDIDKMNKNEI